MVLLTRVQQKALHSLVFGTDETIDPNTMQTLMRDGYVNEHGQATTHGWHAIGEFRFVPEIKIPSDLDIDTWQGIPLHVTESPGQFFRGEINDSHKWAGTKQKEYVFDLFKLMQYYKTIKINEHQWMNAKWDQREDLIYDKSLGFPNSSSNHMALYLGMSAKRSALSAASNEWKLWNTNSLFYGWLDELNKKLTLNKSQVVSTTINYSLQCNEDEIS